MSFPTQEGKPQETDLVNFGKYVGRTYREVTQDQDYCQWILMTAEKGDQCSPGLRRLADFLLELEMRRACVFPQAPNGTSSQASEGEMKDD